MNKDEMVEEFKSQPWNSVLCAVAILSVGEATGLLIGWLLFS
tara:strand:+ start:168 stop:293 length:126 start_codon:yes stop_codon:yes gene_type:complete